MSSSAALPAISTRISHGGYLGTVRFVGAVEGTSGIWLGIEWDDPSRGKHDGVKDGKRYFTCLVPNSGSFIRPSAAVSYGSSFLTALISKYIELPHGSSTLEKVVLGSSHGAIEVEAVGLDKIRSKLAQLERLQQVSLDGEGVSSPDPPGRISSTCPGIRGLDLSRNLIPSWDVVALIVSELPHLQRLALNQNRLLPFSDHARAASAFRTITELQLNATLTLWPALHDVIRGMPSLRSIEMGYNNLRTLPASHGVHLAVKELNLDSNALSGWRATCEALISFPSLQRLVLTANGIQTIDPYPSDTGAARLVNLKHLSLSFNHLRSWRDVDVLPLWCPVLESLTLMGNPLVEDPEMGKNARQFTIAKIGSLIVLDAAGIIPKERTDSELFYLSYLSRHGPPGEDALPRWHELCDKHGKPDSLPATAQERQDTLGSRLIEVHIHRCTEPPTTHPPSSSPSPTPLRVLPTMSIRTLVMKLVKTLKLPRGAPMRLWLRMPNESFAELHGDDARDLAWWGIEDGSEVFVSADGAT
ncbi:RNI-like protein [Laetiporus sulphureus 93-53]|uniref:RNI-like protein n=1 Tax=Laetiporus sulphureus 93-53 TaxID=1314785 RepID=A0A165C6W9_9APHY|nr:RNI-like protein [Laetiporus sulphureus 93-53]KZT02304.1 RNI-like protein [Laetiporus sulphureus 93-53]